MFIFFKKMYSQIDERGILETLKNKISWLPNIVGKFLHKDFFKTFSKWILQFRGGISEFLEKSKKSLNFCFCHYQVFSKSPRGNRKLSKESYALKVRANWITCLNRLPLILSSILENQVNLCHQGRMSSLNMSDASIKF